MVDSMIHGRLRFHFQNKIKHDKPPCIVSEKLVGTTPTGTTCNDDIN